MQARAFLSLSHRRLGTEAAVDDVSIELPTSRESQSAKRSSTGDPEKVTGRDKGVN